MNRVPSWDGIGGKAQQIQGQLAGIIQVPLSEDWFSTLAMLERHLGAFKTPVARPQTREVRILGRTGH